MSADIKGGNRIRAYKVIQPDDGKSILVNVSLKVRTLNRFDYQAQKRTGKPVLFCGTSFLTIDQKLQLTDAPQTLPGVVY